MRNNHHTAVVKRIGNLCFQAEDGVEVLTGEHVVCSALSDDGAILHSDEVIGDSGGMVQRGGSAILANFRSSLFR